MLRVCVRPRALNDARSSPNAASRWLVDISIEAHALPNVEALVHPLPPLVVSDVERRLATLLRRERGEKRRGGSPHRFGGDAGGADPEQAALNRSVRRDALERLRQAWPLSRERQAQELGRRSRRRSRFPGLLRGDRSERPGSAGNEDDSSVNRQATSHVRGIVVVSGWPPLDITSELMSGRRFDFEEFASRKTREATRASIERLSTVFDESDHARVWGVGNAWSRMHYDGDFGLLTQGNDATAMSLVFVQSKDGNTGGDPGALGGGATDMHLIYEGLSRVAADAVLAGARSVGAENVFSVWHPELVALRASLDLPRHPAQIVVSGRGRLNFDALLFNVPEVPRLRHSRG